MTSNSFKNLGCITENNYTIDFDKILISPQKHEEFYPAVLPIEAQILHFSLEGIFFNSIFKKYY